MFRLVLIHQLVLSLLVGPMLCCCSGARLGHDSVPTPRTSTPAEKAPPKHCCGGGEKSPNGGRKAPAEKQPGDPANCPCKDGPAKTATVPEAPAPTSDSLTLLSAGVALFDAPLTLGGPAHATRPALSFDLRSSSVSTADLLFAHHNLRC